MHALIASIPFRGESSVSATQMLWVGLITTVLLLFTFLLLSQAKRRGWLNRWLAQPVNRQLSGKRVWSMESQRVNRNIVVHTLERSGQVLILVESRSSVSVTTLPTAVGTEVAQ